MKDFLTQCFQKDPNLRVSARKLLKHPWILNAHRTDSVVPKKSTEYEEAVKSVQEWNEALRSPGKGDLRRAYRTDSNSPAPLRQELNASRTRSPQARDPLPTAASKYVTDRFRSQESAEDDNWDEDFDTAISPSALRLPHLRPHDNFGGMLSSERLKAFASLDRAVMKPDDSFYADEASGDSQQACESDPLQTIRPFPLRQASIEASRAQYPSRHPNRSSVSSFQNAPILNPNPLPPTRQPRQASLYRENSVEDFSDLIVENEDVLDRKLGAFQEVDSKNRTPVRGQSPTSKAALDTTFNQENRVQPHGQLKRQISVRRNRSAVEIEKFAESERDEDFSDVLGADEVVLDKSEEEDGNSAGQGNLMLTSKLSNNSWLGDQDDEDDPFAQLEEGFDEMDLDANIARDKHARLRNQVEGLVSSLKTSQDDDVLEDISEQLLNIFYDFPETKNIIISAHGMLPILEILDMCGRRDIISNLLKIVNAIIYDDYEIQENLCFVGGIPIINEFASKKYPGEIRFEAAAFVQQMYQTSTLTLQMFVSAGGLNVLVEFLEDDYEDESELVLTGVNGIWSVFELQVSSSLAGICPLNWAEAHRL